jgi:twitching motility protein PilT
MEAALTQNTSLRYAPEIVHIFDKLLAPLHEEHDSQERQRCMAKLVCELPFPEKRCLRNLIDGFLQHMRELGASDIEIGGSQCLDSIWLRIQGHKMVRPEMGRWSGEQTDILILNLLTPLQLERLEKNRAADFSYEKEMDGRIVRWRAAAYADLNHLALNMRAINATVYPYAKLGIPAAVSQSLSLAHEKQGLILLTGITGSGKSTTLDSIIDANNQAVDGHIVIIGDPIEYIHTSKKCIIRHREVGRDVYSFKDGAIQALRQDPDIIVVGEMRDPETIKTCLEIVDTGHKVFSTLHTGSAVETVDRIVAECAVEEQERIRQRLADVLRVIMSQKLIPGVNGKLVLAKEVLLVTSAVKAAIRNKNTHEIYQMISEGGKMGMITLEQDLLRLLTARIITEGDAMDYANNKRRMQELIYQRM